MTTRRRQLLHQEVLAHESDRLVYQNRLERKRNLSYYEHYKVSPCDQNLHLSHQLQCPSSKVTGMLQQDSTSYQLNMRSIDHITQLDHKLGKEPSSGLHTLIRSISTNTISNHKGTTKRPKVENTFITQKVVPGQSLSFSALPGKYSFFELDLNGNESPINFGFSNRGGSGRVKALLLLSFTHQFPKENTALFQFFAAPLTFCLDPSHKYFPEKTLYFSVYSKRESYSLELEVLFGKQPLFLEDKSNSKSLTFYNSLMKYQKGQQAITRQYVQNLSLQDLSIEIAKYYKDKKEQLAQSNQRDLIKVNILKAPESSKPALMRSLTLKSTIHKAKTSAVHQNYQSQMKKKIDNLRQQVKTKEHKQEQKAQEEKERQKVVLQLYQQEVQRTQEKSWLKVIYLTQLVSAMNGIRQALQNERVQRCYQYQITTFIQRRFNRKMLTLGPTIDLRTIGQVRMLGGMQARLVYNLGRNQAENLIQDFLKKRKQVFLLDKKCNVFLSNVVRIQKKIRFYKLAKRVYRNRIIDIIKDTLCRLFEEKHGRFNQTQISERRLESKMQAFSGQLKKFRQNLDRQSKVLWQMVDTFQAEQKEIFVHRFGLYMQQVYDVKRIHTHEKKDVIESYVKKLSRPSQFVEPSQEHVRAMLATSKEMQALL